jgi:hypothetical protein
MKSDAYLVINEYVGPDRLQCPTSQIKAINHALNVLPKTVKTRFKSNRIKNTFYRSVSLKMIIADLSECVDSSNIIPAIHSSFNIVYKKAYGGNILINTLKDISHHFIHPDVETEQMLHKLFEIEDKFLKTHDDDFIFGIYINKKARQKACFKKIIMSSYLNVISLLLTRIGPLYKLIL